MATPAAILAVVVKATGTQATVKQLATVDKSAKVAAKSTEAYGKSAAVAGRKSRMGMAEASRGTGLLAAAVLGLAAASAKAAGEFEKSLNVFQAVSGASAREMRAASKEAKKLGADIRLPATSAKDAAEAMTELAKAGLSVKDTLGAARGVLQLSAAAEVDNATAATIAARALNAFSLKGKEAGRVADVLAAASNASSAEITDVALSFQQASASAAALKVPMEDLATMVGLMANKGVAGSDAGTSLKTMMMRLIPQTDKAAETMKALGLDVFDAEGEFVGIRKTIAIYQRALRKLTPEQQQQKLQVIFGADAQRAANIILGEGVGAFDSMRKAVTKSGAAAAVAGAKTKGLKGSVEALKSTVETLAISFGQVLLPPLTKLLRFLASLGPGIERNKDVIMIAVGALGALAAGVWAVNAAMAANPFVLAAGALVAFGAAVVIAYRESEKFREIVDAVARRVVIIWQGVVRVFQDVVAVVKSVTSAVVAEVSQWDTLFSFISRVVGLMVAQVRLSMSVLKTVWKTAMVFLAPVAAAAWEAVKSVFGAAWSVLKGIVQGGLQVLHGLVKVFGGIFKGDFSQIWEGIKLIFSGAFTALRGLMVGAAIILTAPARMIGAAISSAFSKSWERITEVFRSGVNAAIDFLNLLIGALNAIPGVPDIGKIGRVGGGVKGPADLPASKLARGGAFARTGGLVNRPITLMGEEAPSHPEYVIPTNPAYRSRAQGLLAQAAGAIGFAQGGVYGYGDLVNLAKGAGMSNPGLMAAIAMAESGGRAGITNSIGARGLWQIIPSTARAFKLDYNRLDEPAYNAMGAARILRGQGLSAWDAYTNGAYRKYQGGGGGMNVVGTVTGVMGDLIGQGASAITSKFPGVGKLPEWLKGTGKWVLGKATAWVKDQVDGLFAGGGEVGLGDSGRGWPLVMGLARKYGMSVTSAFRPGDPGWHGKNRAKDFATPGAGGPSPGQMGFARGVSALMGSNLLELIYTPLGFAIKNGQKTAPYAAADHYDHVHVAMRQGGVWGAPFLGAYKDGGVLPRDGFYYGHAGESVIAARKGAAVKKGRRRSLRTAPTTAGQKRAREILALRRRYPTKGRPGDFVSQNGGEASEAPVPATAMEFAQAGVAVAALTADYRDDISAAAEVLRLARDDYAKAVSTGDPRLISEAAGQLKSAAEAVRAAERTPTDFVNAAIAQAALTKDLADDLEAWKRLEQIRVADYQAAVKGGDPRAIAETANALADAQNSIDQLEEQMSQANELARKKQELDEQIASNQLKILALAGQESKIIAAVVAAASGGIGGKTGMAAMTPGAPGTVAWYGRRP